MPCPLPLPPSFITAYNVGLNKAVKLMRSLLPEYDGYECKEPEAGKVTVAFRWGGWVGGWVGGWAVGGREQEARSRWPSGGRGGWVGGWNAQWAVRRR